MKSLHKGLFEHEVLVVILAYHRTPRFRVRLSLSFAGLLEIAQLNSKMDRKQWPRIMITALELLDLIPASNRNSSKTNFEFSTSFLHTVNPFPISSLTLIQSLLLGGHTHTAFQITFFITLPLRFRATWNTVFVSGDKMPDAKMHKNWWPNCEDELRIGTANLIVQFWF